MKLLEKGHKQRVTPKYHNQTEGVDLRRVACALLSSRFVRRRAGGMASEFLHGVTEVRLDV